MYNPKETSFNMEYDHNNAIQNKSPFIKSISSIIGSQNFICIYKILTFHSSNIGGNKV